MIGDERIAYPCNHIEADNRLAWLLGRLDHRYGGHAFFVHLLRQESAVAESYSKRLWWEGSIPRAYRDGILMLNQSTDFDVCLDFVRTVNANIEFFLRDKQNKMEFNLEAAEDDFEKFWYLVGAEGNLTAALDEWKHNSNTTEEMLRRQQQQSMSLEKSQPNFAKLFASKIKKKLLE
ncbi:hypothetical protein [Roseovarius sp. D22-M7]|uniref:hypothetical protein n=1 Tax=Roseovarius sp. D22-M7 TaxID=3127116 RepID=UPI0030103BB3